MPTLIRPAHETDLLAMGRLAQAAYHHSDSLHEPRSWPVPAPRPPERAVQWAERTAVTLTSDPEGVWVAEDDGEVVGLAVSRRREGLWILSSFAVSPRVQGRGIGARLLAEVLAVGEGLPGMFCSSNDPAALRRYRQAGFDLHPFLAFRGTVARSALPTPARLRDATPADREFFDTIDRMARGAGHGVDHTVLGAQFSARVAEGPAGRGYVYIGAHGAPQLLAASSQQVAEDLLWEALAHSNPSQPVTVHHISTANQWALDVGLAARLSLATSGHLALRDGPAPRYYLPHGSLL